MRLYGSRRISTVGFWDMSDFLLILTVFSWSPLELLLDWAIVCSFIHLDHVDALSVPGTVLCASNSRVTLHYMIGEQRCMKSDRPRPGSQPLIHQPRDVTGLLTSLGLGSSLP